MDKFLDFINKSLFEIINFILEYTDNEKNSLNFGSKRQKFYGNETHCHKLMKFGSTQRKLFSESDCDNRSPGCTSNFKYEDSITICSSSILWDNLLKKFNKQINSTSFPQKILSQFEMESLNAIHSTFLTNTERSEIIMKNHGILYSLWQKLHTGHWSEIPLGLRVIYSWCSITLAGLLLQQLKRDLEKESPSIKDVMNCATKIIQVCDRGLLMGIPLENNPLNDVASLLNKPVMDSISEGQSSRDLSTPSEALKLLVDKIPEEAVPLSNVTPLEVQNLPSLHYFLLEFLNRSRPLKILGIAEEWPALKKWDLEFFRIKVGSRTVPVEIGHRYSDQDWSQTLLTFDDYLSSYCNGESISKNQTKAYMAQHQLFDQIPELLSDIIIPDYCHMGQGDPILNAWIGPSGTVTPLHFDPDHNILVQVYGYKVLLLFPESDSEFLYPFVDDLLKNTSRINLEEVAKREAPFEEWPLLREARGHYLVLGPGDAVYIPPKWWHFVRSLSNSISVSFWWR